MKSTELSDPEAWKAVVHPLRLGILRVLGKNELTNEELATELGVASGKLHFHTMKLLKAGLIEPAGTRKKGPITEKMYRRTAHQFTVPMFTDGERSPLGHFVSNALALYEKSWEGDNLTLAQQFGFHQMFYVTEETRQRVFQQFREIMADLEASSVDSETPTAVLFSVAGLANEVPGEQA